MPKLTKDSPAMVRLRTMFERGELKVYETPKMVWESDDLFQKHKLANFRAQYNLLKKQYPSSQDDYPSQRPKLFEEAEESDVEESELADTKVAKEDYDLRSSSAFKPIYMVSEWKENITRRKRLSVALLLPSGVEKGMFSLRVGENSRELELVIKWPKPLIDLEMLHRGFLRDESQEYKVYHPEFTGFEESLRDLRANNKDWVTTNTSIPLPFNVETHIHQKFNLTWESSTARIIYIRLKAAVEDYGVSNDNEDFIVL